MVFHTPKILSARNWWSLSQLAFYGEANHEDTCVCQGWTVVASLDLSKLMRMALDDVRNPKRREITAGSQVLQNSQMRSHIDSLAV